VLNEVGSGLEPGDVFDKQTGVILCKAASQARRRDRWRAWFYLNCMREQRKWRKSYMESSYYRKFFLHTNASGDFILAPRKAFFDVHGMPETIDFYMHLDTYAIVQLFAAGYEQAVFAQPHRVYHADHDRSGRADFNETITFAEHEAELSKILRRERSYRLNGSDWGLANLPSPAPNGDTLSVKGHGEIVHG
jgi:GT2 family glycosyltransferase